METINELIAKLNELADKGYGNMPIYLDAFNGEQGKQYKIDSIQKNTNPNIEPDYFFFMDGEEVQSKDRKC